MKGTIFNCELEHEIEQQKITLKSELNYHH